MANGSRHSLYAVEEVTTGTTPNNPALELVRITGTTLGLNKDTLQSNEIRDDRQLSDLRMGSNQVGGDVSFELSYGTFDKFLSAALMATAGWVADTPAVGTDQIKAGKGRQAFTFVRYFSDIAEAGKPYYVYRGCEINSISLSIAANAMITGSFTVIGQSQELLGNLSTLGVPTYPAPSTTSPLDSFSGALKENGTTIAVITELQLTLENNISPRFVVGSKNSIDPSVGRSNCTGTITAFFEDSTLVEKFINEEESDIEFELPDSAGNLLKIIIPRIKYTGGQPDVSGEGPITLSMPFQALLDTAEGTNIIMERTPA